ncbi:hypothetical protein [Streptomyces sp. CO7]
MLYELVLFTLLFTGLACAGTFLVLHRPRRFFRVVEINSSWWVLLVALVYLRSLILLVVHGADPGGRAWWDLAVSVGFLAAVDALLLVRLVSYARYLRANPQRT